MGDRTRNIKLYVGNLPFDATEDELRSLLHGCGQIRFLIVRKNAQTNKSKGYAHIEYRHEYECVEAFKRLIGKEIRGRILKIDWCDEVYRERYPDLMLAATTAYSRGQIVQPPPVLRPIEPIGRPDTISVPIESLSTHIDHLTGIIPPAPPELFPKPVEPIKRPAEPFHDHFIAPDHLPGIIEPINHPVGVYRNPVPRNPEYNAAAYGKHLNELKKLKNNNDLTLVNELGRLGSDEILEVIKDMSMVDIFNLVKKIDSFMIKSPNTVRSILAGNQRMCRALVHAKLLLGYRTFKFNERTEQIKPKALHDYFYMHTK
ncbi:RNA recognition motif domain-containing protein [Theileria equi strain WA]|uniref:RNA recognition motif domain-containing protein n=1 Tax=Theileria equi strain WA TaxID=1537102 RepID=L0AYV0_THEEQ|nr:RNA recognition motif domain-containing protein [Theileria equi strain WA]AFZ80745.1 RNA recognition motif domain-containing protein [Theileria equi strain WA]|eukprot:XP_004830411.1 RNA recognition motif domain-containing protein [Theileria equi strain WA]